nr:uncharacterized protein LOC123753244 [Procambarus clarkii]
MKNMATFITGVGKVWTPFMLHRCVSTSAPLSARGIRRVLRSLNLSEEETGDLSIDELEAISSSDMEALQGQASQIEVDAKNYQKHIRRQIIKQKYFRDYEPKEENLLTWAMKEQLRYLHLSDPDMWTPEALSLSFPISPAGAQKLLKAKWTMKSEADVQRHDRAVAARWKRHMKGKLGSATLLQQTLNITSNKGTQLEPTIGVDEMLSTLESLEFHSDEKPHVAEALKLKNKLPKVKKMKGGSFSSIIKDYESQVSELHKVYQEPHDPSPSSPSRCHDIREITPATPTYDGTYSHVAYPADNIRKRFTKVKKREEMLTFSEFMKTKKL